MVGTAAAAAYCRIHQPSPLITLLQTFLQRVNSLLKELEALLLLAAQKPERIILLSRPRKGGKFRITGVYFGQFELVFS